MPLNLKPLLSAAIFLSALGAGLAPSAQAAPAACTAKFSIPLAVPIDGQIAKVVIDDQCRFIYATNHARNRVEVFSLDSKSLVATIPVGNGPLGLDVNAEGTRLYVANNFDTSISVIDTAARTATRISVPGSSPRSVAVAANGLVLIEGNYYPGSFQYRPGDTAVTSRSDSSGGILQASGDRSVIVAAGTWTAARYIVSEATFDRGQSFEIFSNIDGQNTTLSTIAPDYTGQVYLAANGIVADHVLNPRARIAGLSSADIALDGNGAFGYQANGTVVDVIRMSDQSKIEPLPLNSTAAANGGISLSHDGTVLAAATTTGFSVMSVGPMRAAPPVRIFAFPGMSGGNVSFLRAHNTGTSAATIHVTLTDFSTGRDLAGWESPPIPPNTAPQFPLYQIEAGATPTIPSKPAFYRLAVRTTMTGTVAHVILNPVGGAIVNASTCAFGSGSAGGYAPLTSIGNVHSAQLAAYPSYINVVNTSGQAADVTLAIRDAVSGDVLGTYTLAALKGSQLVQVASMEAAAHITPGPTTLHYIVEVQGSFSGYLQHLVRNPSGALADLSAACSLNTN